MADCASLAHYPAVGVSVYLALTFGFRLAGIGELIKLFRFPKERPFHLLLAVFIVLGPVISLSSKIVPQGAPFGDNNAIWFMVQSKFAATLLAALALAGIWRRLKQIGRAAMIVLVAAISFPSTIDYVVKKQHAQNELEKPIVDGISFLNREARPGDVVVSHIDSAIVTLTQLRVPFIPLFPSSFAGQETASARSADMKEFWRSWMEGEVREDLLSRYHISWIVVPRQYASGIFVLQPSADAGRQVSPVFTNDQIIIHRVHQAHSSPG